MKPTRRIIIEVEEGIDDRDAAFMVAQVINHGRVSQTWKKKWPHYSWLLVFERGIVVCTRRKRTPTAADSFLVYREPEHADADR